MAGQSGMTPEQSEFSNARRAVAGKFLTFYLGDEEYGLEILKVQEIIGLVPITRVPGTPAFIRGVINLRGKVIPVSDLRLKFGMPDVEPTTETCVIIVEANGLNVGLVVDRVREVLSLNAEQIESAPVFGADLQTDFLLGMGKAHERVQILLDIDRVLSRTEIIDLRLATHPQTSH